MVPTPVSCAELYSIAFPDRPPMAVGRGWLTGTWCIGAMYRNPNPLYGAYPRGYLERVHAMFPEATRVLHAFSGGLTKEVALGALQGGLSCHKEVELVDTHGPEDERHPTWRGSVASLPDEWGGRFDLILADPPYSKADAERYGTPMPNRAAVIRELRRVAQVGATLVWLDTMWPPHRKAQWRCWGQIGLVRSTNHRVRLVSMFEAV